MPTNRRKFLKDAVKAGGALMLSSVLPIDVFSAEAPRRLTILHTNDVHSRLEPFPMDGSRNAGMGGVAARAEIIKKIRSEESNILLLDAGDIFQGTPYFNIYKGEPEIKAMTMMGYDAATMGNHDFDGGIENFANQLVHAKFPIVVCNYDFTGTPMEGRFVPYKIIQKGNIKIGIVGVGIELNGLVPEHLYGNTKYNDPIASANKVASYLKTTENCEMIICLSHLGDRYDDNKLSDAILAKESYDIDLIIGGHTHKFFEVPRIYKNKKGSDVVVNQAGWAGLQLGRLDFEFTGNRNKNLVATKSVVIAKKTAD